MNEIGIRTRYLRFIFAQRKMFICMLSFERVSIVGETLEMRMRNSENSPLSGRYHILHTRLMAITCDKFITSNCVLVGIALNGSGTSSLY